MCHFELEIFVLSKIMSSYKNSAFFLFHNSQFRFISNYTEDTVIAKHVFGNKRELRIVTQKNQEFLLVPVIMNMSHQESTIVSINCTLKHCCISHRATALIEAA